MRLIKTLAILLPACSPLQTHQDGPQAASAPTVTTAQGETKDSPAPVSGTQTTPLWVLCDPAAPSRGFCVSLEQAKQIRIRHQQALARATRPAIDEREKREKAEARVEATAAQARKDVAVTAVIGGAISLVLMIAGGLVGAFAF